MPWTEKTRYVDSTYINLGRRRRLVSLSCPAPGNITHWQGYRGTWYDYGLWVYYNRWGTGPPNALFPFESPSPIEGMSAAEAWGKQRIQESNRPPPETFILSRRLA